MRDFEEKAFAEYNGVLPEYYRRYVDDSFLLFEKKEDIEPFFEFLNNCHPNIKFTIEEESHETSTFPFLDVNIMKHENRFLTQTYYKPTHTGQYTNWHRFTPRKYKLKIVKCLLSRARICSNQELFDNWMTGCL